MTQPPATKEDPFILGPIKIEVAVELLMPFIAASIAENNDRDRQPERFDQPESSAYPLYQTINWLRGELTQRNTPREDFMSYEVRFQLFLCFLADDIHQDMLDRGLCVVTDGGDTIYAEEFLRTLCEMPINLNAFKAEGQAKSIIPQMLDQATEKMQDNLKKAADDHSESAA